MCIQHSLIYQNFSCPLANLNPVGALLHLVREWGLYGVIRVVKPESKFLIANEGTNIRGDKNQGGGGAYIKPMPNRVFQKNLFSFVCKCKPGGHVIVSYQSNKKKLGILSLISGIATMFSVGFESEEGDK